MDIAKRYNAKRGQRIELNISRWKEFPELLKDFGFKKGVEIGVYRGQYTELLSKSFEMTGVDAWEIYPGYKDYEVTDIKNAYKEAQERAERCNFKLIKNWSLEAVKEFEDESLDFIFIDGNHDFRHVTDDLDEWSKKVKKGGVVAGHDFFRKKGFGVKDAVPAWCYAHGISPLYIIKKDHCPSWFYVA